MVDAEWKPVPDEHFQEDLQGEIAVATVTIPVESRETPGPAIELILDPLPQLMKYWSEVVTEGWTVSLHRMNAEVAIPFPAQGPRKIVVVFVASIVQQHVHGTVYRAS